jgi:hypothetical protein
MILCARPAPERAIEVGSRLQVLGSRSVASDALTRRYGSPWSDARYKPARSAASSILCSSPETRPQFGLSKRSDRAFRLEGQLWVR